MCHFSRTVLEPARKKTLRNNRNKLGWPFSSFMFWIDESWNRLGPCRSSLDLCFINTVCLSNCAIYKVHLNSGRRAIGDFDILRRSAKMHMLAKFKRRAQVNLKKGIFFVLSYSTHMWNAHVAENLLTIKKNRKNKACLWLRQNTFNYFEKITKMWRFMNLNRLWK